MNDSFTVRLTETELLGMRYGAFVCSCSQFYLMKQAPEIELNLTNSCTTRVEENGPIASEPPGGSIA